MNWQVLRIAIVGPLPPPRGGMAGQTQQLADLLRGEGAQVLLVRTNSPYRPGFIAPIRGVRAIFRLVGYVARLWNAAAHVDIFHVMANSGLSWHVFAAPAIWVARLRGRRVLVNYRGGEAKSFLESCAHWVRPSIQAASALAVPSQFLKSVFAQFGMESHIVPNIVDLSRFHPVGANASERYRDVQQRYPGNQMLAAGDSDLRTVLVARNLEPIYDIPSALRAFAVVAAQFPDARLIVAGEGPEGEALKALARQLGIESQAQFPGRLDREQMAARYREADVVLNPSRVDNMPNSLLEAMASGVPIVSTNVGGVPYVVEHERTALLVGAGNSEDMAAAITRLFRDPQLAARLAAAALTDVRKYDWPSVRDILGGLYESILSRSAAPAHMH